MITLPTYRVFAEPTLNPESTLDTNWLVLTQAVALETDESKANTTSSCGLLLQAAVVMGAVVVLDDGG